MASIADEASSSDEDAPFEFDNYDIDEIRPRAYANGIRIPPPPTPRAAINQSVMDELDVSSPLSRSFLRLKRRGALLWSSHWFFLNRKKKRILYTSVWARSTGIGRMYTRDEDEYSIDLESPTERFKGWEGSIGLGARSLGLKGY